MGEIRGRFYAPILSVMATYWALPNFGEGFSSGFFRRILAEEEEGSLPSNLDPGEVLPGLPPAHKIRLANLGRHPLL